MCRRSVAQGVEWIRWPRVDCRDRQGCVRNDSRCTRCPRCIDRANTGHHEGRPRRSAAPGAAQRIEIHESAHPVPDKRSLEAGESLLRWLNELPRSVEPLFLISGGASSLVEVLEDGVTFEQLGQLNAEGLASGIPIGELNARRSKLSRIKGGGVARLLGDRPARALFISDVPQRRPGCHRLRACWDRAIGPS